MKSAPRTLSRPSDIQASARRPWPENSLTSLLVRKLRLLAYLLICMLSRRLKLDMLPPLVDEQVTETVRNEVCE